MSLLLDRLFAIVALGHLAVDILNGQRAVLLAYLSGLLGLTNTALSLVTTVYVAVGALSQPVFGHLADRWGPRWLVAGGTLWMGAFFSMALFAPGYWSLALLVIASLGSGAFHPAGTMEANLRGRERYSDRETTATAYFFLFGQMGGFFGPLIGGPLLGLFGPPGLIALVAPAVVVGVSAAYRLPSKSTPSVHPGSRLNIGRILRAGLSTSILAFGLMTAFQSWAQQNMITFVPKYLSDLGQPPGVYGLVSALFMAGVAFGNLAGGNLADRYGKRRVAIWTLLAASAPLLAIPYVSSLAWLFLLIPLSGFLTGATHSIIVVLAQRRLPSGIALASGLVLGFMFTSGALGTLLSGYLADLRGLPIVFTLSGVLVLLAAGLAFTIKEQPTG
jgi:FSR family fosmidomycin resistance protein-like MFS transporter